jgi:hypothetical protein
MPPREAPPEENLPAALELFCFFAKKSQAIYVFNESEFENVVR